MTTWCALPPPVTVASLPSTRVWWLHHARANKASRRYITIKKTKNWPDNQTDTVWPKPLVYRPLCTATFSSLDLMPMWDRDRRLLATCEALLAHVLATEHHYYGVVCYCNCWNS